MSEAPIISGTCQFANPTKAGMTAPKTMIRPCIVVSWLKNSGRRICRPGWNSSVRSSSAFTPPTSSIANENHRYIVPMSLWLVANSQRRHPVGWSCAWSCAWSPGWSRTALISLGSC